MTGRPLRPDERAVLAFLLERDFPGRDELRAQARSVQTTGLSCTCGCPSFALEADRSIPAAPVADRVPTDAHGMDPAGNEVGVLLFVDDGYLSEVEVYRLGDGGFAGLPDPSALKLSEWSRPTERGVRHLLNP
jgi:hypothetical protein